MATNKYLIKLTYAKVYHLWNDEDTACGLKAIGEYNPQKYIKSDRPGALPLCKNCNNSSMLANPVIQPWVLELKMMQQTVLLTAVRGPDGLGKYHPAKYILRWYRRCILKDAIGGEILINPHAPGGGSFTGPSIEILYNRGILLADGAQQWPERMEARVTDYLRVLDEVPHHFQMHLMHAAEIVGYKHPNCIIRKWWHQFYVRLAHDLHLWPETHEQMDARLCDNRDGWLARADSATVE